MSVIDWRVGAATTTTINVVVHCSATETVTVGVGGKLFTGSADIGVHDGQVVVACTGLQPDTLYSYTVNGVSGGAVRTQKTAPTEAWVASGSCWSASREDVLSRILTARGDIDLMLLLGDSPYCETTVNLWGETPTSTASSVAAGKLPETYRAHYRQFARIPGVNDIMHNIPCYRIRDDHELPWDNGSPNGFADYQSYMPGGASATQQDFDTAWAAAEQVAVENTLGFVHGFDSDVTPADANAMYGSYKIGELVEVFVLDCVGHRSDVLAADDANKTMLGAAQYARFVDAITRSTATWKLIASPKQFFKAGPNTDTWNNHGDNPGFETEKAALLYALRNVTGMLAVGGDQHLWSDQWVDAGELGTDMPAISMIVGCPTSVDVNATGIDGYLTGVKSKYNDYLGTPHSARDNAVAVFRFTPTRAYRYLMTTRLGMIGCGYLDAGSNQVRYQRARIG